MNFPKLTVICVGVSILTFYFVTGSRGCHQGSIDKTNIPVSFHIQSEKDLVNLFSLNPQQISQLTDTYIACCQKSIDAIIAIEPKERTFANTIAAFDRIGEELEPLNAIVVTLKETHPQEQIRDAARNANVKIEQFSVESIGTNRDLYLALRTYADGNAKQETLNKEQEYFLQEAIAEYELNGLGLEDEKLAQAKTLKKDLVALAQTFQQNISTDKSYITAKKEELTGLDNDFIESLEKIDNNLLKIPFNIPNYFTVMKYCSHGPIREKMDTMRINVAYPSNDPILKEFLKKSDQLAKLIGFKNFAELDCVNQMVGSPQKAYKFLDELFEKASAKATKEFNLLSKNLPDGITLSQNGKFYPWDYPYVKEQYIKKHFSVDDNKIAEYFPTEKTIKGLLDIYQTFFSLNIQKIATNGLWHEDAVVLKVSDATGNKLIGYIILDLYPRENKYNHGCHIPIIHAIKHIDGSVSPAVSVILANFPKATAHKPSLLKFDDAKTMFHEFGHAMHSLLGATEMAGFAGTSVKRDFVEMTSQMLEEWLHDPEILKMISCHYKTGKPLSDTMIADIMKLKNFSYGFSVQGQMCLARASLDSFATGENKDPHTIFTNVYQKTMPYVDFSTIDIGRIFAGFPHIWLYKAKYYSYLWSWVFSIDLFNHIKQHGLLNPIIGQKYINEVIGKGGSKHPDTLLKNFLGREPNQKAFLKYLGFV